jgi:hypothetical protein
MDANEGLAERFEEHRIRLRAVAGPAARRDREQLLERPDDERDDHDGHGHGQHVQQEAEGVALRAERVDHST